MRTVMLGALLSVSAIACSSTDPAATGQTDAAASVDAASPTRLPDAPVMNDDVATPTSGGATPSVSASDMAEIPSERRVLMISIDGLHSHDLDLYLRAKPNSTLALLAAQGVRYARAMAPFPSDSFPSVLAWATGGTPRSTGVFFDISYDRSLSPAGSTCATKGALVDFSDAADLDPAMIDGGGGLNPAALPRNPAAGCAPVFPHDYLRVNTIFEVVREKGYRTAYAEKHLTYEVLNGPSGKGVLDLFNPEIAAVDTKVVSGIQGYDKRKVDAVLNQIRGKTHAGAAATVPALFGMNFQAVSVVQKATTYLDAAGTPSEALTAAIDFVDQSIGSMVAGLKQEKLWDSTVLVVGASHGQSPIDPNLVQRIGTTVLPALVNQIAPNLLAHATQDAVALLWLNDQSKAPAVAALLVSKKAAAGIEQVVAGADLIKMFGDPTVDPRIPDIMVIVKPGVIYTDSKKKVAEHGGFSEDDRKVALMIVGAGRLMPLVPDVVDTRQLAPTILRALKLDPRLLKAVVAEGTALLPGLTFP